MLLITVPRSPTYHCGRRQAPCTHNVRRKGIKNIHWNQTCISCTGNIRNLKNSRASFFIKEWFLSREVWQEAGVFVRACVCTSVLGQWTGKYSGCGVEMKAGSIWRNARWPSSELDDFQAISLCYHQRHTSHSQSHTYVYIPTHVDVRGVNTPTNINNRPWVH